MSTKRKQPNKFVKKYKINLTSSILNLNPTEEKIQVAEFNRCAIRYEGSCKLKRMMNIFL